MIFMIFMILMMMMMMMMIMMIMMIMVMMIVSMMICLVVWNNGMDYDFPETVGNVIIPTDKLFHIFQRGRLKPPTRYVSTIFNLHEDGDLM